MKDDMNFTENNFKDGFSLVEMLIATSVTAIVLAGMILILSYTLRNANLTQARAAMQDEAKDVMNHITGYVMEGNHVKWEGAPEKCLTVLSDEPDPAPLPSGSPAPGTRTTTEKRMRVEKYSYYLKDGKLYFINIKRAGADRTAWAEKKYLLAEDVEDFTVTDGEGNNPDDKDRILLVRVKLKNDDSEFDCEQTIHIRNACNGNCT